ncbi:MAG: NAD(P)/FAD-dependent oxidoreductase [Mycobacteriales bacterium]
MRTRKRIVVVGGNFGGLTAALTVKKALADEADVTVVSASDRFLFTPSLIWVPFGLRRPEQLRFPLRPTLESHGVGFVHAEATRIDAVGGLVTTPAGDYAYDYLVIATGFRNRRDAVPGMVPDNGVYTITTPRDAVRAGEGWRRFLEDRRSGDTAPLVVAAAPGAGCFGAAYEFLFNAAYQLRRVGLADRVPLTYVTPEPYLGHFGIGGLPGGRGLLSTFFRRQGIEAVSGAEITEIAPGKMALASGETLDFGYAMVIPPFAGREVVAAVPNLTDTNGFVRVRNTYQSLAYPDICAVGAAAAVSVPWMTPVPVGVPKTGFPTEVQARTAARNIAVQVRGGVPHERRDFGKIPAVCVMDAGNNGVMILADRMLPPRRAGVLIPGPQSHAAKVLFERYHLWKSRHGYTSLP